MTGMPGLQNEYLPMIGWGYKETYPQPLSIYSQLEQKEVSSAGAMA